MHRRNLSMIFLSAILSAISTICFAQNHPDSTNRQDSAVTSAQSTSSVKNEGCKLHPYTGPTPLDRLQDYSQGEEDLRGGMTCIFSINPSLPVFTFDFIGQPDNTLGDIRITEGRKTDVIQTIENSTDAGLINPEMAQHVLVVVDANFDGYKDLQVLSQCGATGNCSYDFYLYDHASNQFVRNKFLSNLSPSSFDDAKKQVTMHGNGGADDWETETYQYQNGQYTLIWRQTSAWDRNKHAVIVNTYELRNGKMVLTDSDTEAQ